MKPITKEKIGWGFIGPGWIATEFAEGINMEVSDGYVAAVGSRALDRAQTFADTYGGKAYGSYEEMLCDPDVDVVYVATPHPVHMENVIMAAEHGKHILCEKPFCVNKKQAEAMFAAAEKNDVFIMEGLWSRFFPAWKYVREVLDSGELGQLVSIDSATCWGGPRSGGNPNRRHRLWAPELAGGSLLDAGVYSLASMSVAMGKVKQPKNIYSTMRFTDTGVDSDVDMLLEFDDGFTAHLISSLHRRNFETTIYCENGKIYIPQHRNPRTVTVTKSALKDGRFVGNETITKDFPFRSHGFQFEAMAVHECLRNGWRTSPYVTPEETLTLIGICDTVREQNGLKYPFE